MTVIYSNRPSLYLLWCNCWDNQQQRQFHAYVWSDNWSARSLTNVLRSAGKVGCSVLCAAPVDPATLQFVEVAA